MQRVARVRQQQLSYLLKFCPSHIFGIGEAIGTSNFVNHKSTSARIIYYPQRGCVMCHVTSSNFAKQVIIFCQHCIAIVAMEH